MDCEKINKAVYTHTIIIYGNILVIKTENLQYYIQNESLNSLLSWRSEYINVAMNYDQSE
jgi:hypothetical protein